jgi:hypothetical protein
VFTGSILSNGGIGIGTSAITSGYSLDVNGPSYFRSSTTITGSGGMYYNIRTTSSADAAIFMFDGANTGYVGLNVGANPNKFVIYYAADTRMAIDTSGRVGFGTSSPNYNLEINSGSSSPTELAVVNTNAAGAARLSLRNAERDFILTSNTADDLLSFAYGGSNRLQFHTSSQWFNSGNVGIGTSSPDRPLDIYSAATVGIARIRANNVNGAAITIANDENNHGVSIYSAGSSGFGIGGWANNAVIESGTGIVYSAYNGSHIFQSGVSGRTERMRITSGGDVGIGTTTPTTILTIRKPIDSSAYGAGTRMIDFKSFFPGFDTETVKASIYAGVSSLLESRTDNGYLAFMTADSGTLYERMRIEKNGQVQIKQTGNTHNDGFSLINTSSNNWNFVNGGDNNLYLGFQGTSRGVFATNGTYSAISDINKKKDFEVSTIGLNAVLGLKPTLFRMKYEDELTEKQLGFIAQEVKDFIPQAYTETINGDDKFIGLNDRPIVAALVKAIQEQQTLITALEEKLERNNII